MKLKIEFQFDGDEMLDKKYAEFLAKNDLKPLADRLIKGTFYALELPIGSQVSLNHLIVTKVEEVNE
jgi:hypothetical protein